MNILFLCHRLPYPPNKGDKIRSFNILRYLTAQHNVRIGTFVDDPADNRHIASVEAMTNGPHKILPITSPQRWGRMAAAIADGRGLSIAPFESAEMRNWVLHQLSSDIDLVIVFGSAMVSYLFKSGWAPEKVVFDMVDIDSDKWAQYADNSSWPMSAIFKREAKAVLKLEKQASQTFLRTALVSPFETDTFAKIAPEVADKLVISRNGVDLSFYDPDLLVETPFPTAHTPLVMTGRMDYRPNYEGAKWFADDVLPLIVAQNPSCHFYIVGANPPSSLSKALNTNATVVGEVADIRPYLKHAAVSVAPLKIARGVQNKVLEGMAMGRPVVATSVASRALGAVSGSQLLIADTADEFAASVVLALDPNRAITLGQQGRSFVETEYSWKANLAVLDRM